MTEEEAILLIQRHERARQCRMRAQIMKNIRELKDRTKGRRAEEISEDARISALKIQRTWRGFITRRKIRKRVLEEMLLIGESYIITTVILFLLVKYKIMYSKYFAFNWNFLYIINEVVRIIKLN